MGWQAKRSGVVNQGCVSAMVFLQREWEHGMENKMHLAEDNSGGNSAMAL